MVEYNRYAVGRVIRQLRKERHLSQEVFSGLTGLAHSHLAMIESGRKQANFETIWRIAVAFDVLPHVLVQRIEEEAAKEQQQSLPTK